MVSNEFFYARIRGGFNDGEVITVHVNPGYTLRVKTLTHQRYKPTGEFDPESGYEIYVPAEEDEELP